jgi:RimJ/RimL family protein N-acetyltransferase
MDEKEVDFTKDYWENYGVRLRPVRFEDWKKYYDNLSDSDGMFLLYNEIELPYDEENAKLSWREWVGNGVDKDDRIKFAIDTIIGINVGRANIHGIDERNGTFGIGIQINDGYRGKSYGTSAMKIMLDYAFNERRLHKFQTFIIEGNIASEKMLTKLGCVKEGVIRDAVFHKGKYWNQIHYGLLAEEYNQLCKEG